MFLRASILAYTQQFHWSLVRLAVFVVVNSRASCLLTPSISVTVNFNNTSSTTHRSLCLNGINSCCVSSPHATTTLCFSTVNHVYTTFCGTFLYSSVNTSTCRFAERAVLRFFRDRFTLRVHHYTEPVYSSLTTASRVAPARPKMLSIALVIYTCRSTW